MLGPYVRCAIRVATSAHIVIGFGAATPLVWCAGFRLPKTAASQMPGPSVSRGSFREISQSGHARTETGSRFPRPPGSAGARDPQETSGSFAERVFCRRVTLCDGAHPIANIHRARIRGTPQEPECHARRIVFQPRGVCHGQTGGQQNGGPVDQLTSLPAFQSTGLPVNR